MLEADEAFGDLLGWSPSDDRRRRPVLGLHLAADVAADLRHEALDDLRAKVGLRRLRELDDQRPQEGVLAEPALGPGLLGAGERARCAGAGSS